VFQTALRPALFLTIVASALTGIHCGYVRAGRWDDDARNWKRAFGEAPPTKWRIVRSRYWRSAHWTYEAGYYFHVELSSEVDRSFIEPDFVRMKPGEPGVPGACGPRPAWFAPRNAAEYEIWRAPGTGNYRILVNGRDMFFMDCQY